MSQMNDSHPVFPFGWNQGTEPGLSSDSIFFKRTMRYRQTNARSPVPAPVNGRLSFYPQDTSI